MENIGGLELSVIGPGEGSIRKSYYPELQQRISELERLTNISLEHCVNLVVSISLQYFQQPQQSSKFIQCSPKVGPGDAIFCSIWQQT
jgi:hypothetical protein